MRGWWGEGVGRGLENSLGGTAIFDPRKRLNLNILNPPKANRENKFFIIVVFAMEHMLAERRSGEDLESQYAIQQGLSTFGYSPLKGQSQPNLSSLKCKVKGNKFKN